MSYILCLRIDDADSRNVVKGATITNCSKCDSRVWISPASVEVMTLNEAKPICFPCAKIVSPDGPDEIAPITEEQLKEAIEHMKNENQTDRLRE